MTEAQLPPDVPPDAGEQAGSGGQERRPHLAVNMAWNWAGAVAETVTAFIVAPLLVGVLGEADYGYWILLGSVAGYMALMDLGVRGSVGRYIAYYRAKGDIVALRGVVRSGVMLSGAAGLIILVLAVGLDPVFMRMFNVPPEATPQMRLALWLVVTNLAVSLPLNVFDALLWGAERFDRLNQISIPAAVLRLAASYWVVSAGFGLVGLAAALLILSLLVAAAKAVAALQVEPTAFSWGRGVTPGMARILFRYGLPLFVLTVTRMTRLQLIPATVGWVLGPTRVTHYSLSRRLVDYGDSFVYAFTGVVTPTFALLQAKGESEKAISLFTLGGRLSGALGMLFAGFALSLGGPFLALWLGPQWAAYTSLLCVMTLGEVIPISQSATANMLVGMARHRYYAGLLVAEVVVIGIGGVLASQHYGLMGLCIVPAISATVFRGLLVIRQGCNVLGVPLRRYLMTVLAPAAVACGLAGVALQAMVTVIRPTTWARFVVDLGVYGILALGALLVLGGRPLVDMVRGRLLGSRG
jgi:O-antigen/teichoic acid export membrane protein